MNGTVAGVAKDAPSLIEPRHHAVVATEVGVMPAGKPAIGEVLSPAANRSPGLSLRGLDRSAELAPVNAPWLRIRVGDERA
jgi:hypothetical protein